MQQQQQVHILSLDTFSFPGIESRVKNIFSESSNVAYQIYGNEA